MKTAAVLCCLLYVISMEASEINMEGFVGGEVLFQCSHKLAWNHEKYFCKDPCKSRDVLVTVAPGGKARSGRIDLEDSGNGVFSVNFSQLQLSDSHKYYCAVNRGLFQTYITVQLTVKEAVTVEATTAILDASSASTQQIITNSTQLPTEINTFTSTNISTASNFTDRPEQDDNTDIILSVTVGGVLTLIVMVLVAYFCKCRKVSKPQPAVFFTSTNQSNEYETEVDCEYDDIGEVLQRAGKVSRSMSNVPQQPLKDPLASPQRATECSASRQIYQNISFYKREAGSRLSAAPDQRDATPRTDVKPLRCSRSERIDDGSHRKKHKYTRGYESNEVTPKSLWFGLDLSGLN